MKKTLAASPDFLLERDGPVLYLNGNKYAIIAKCTDSKMRVTKAVFMCHSPRPIEQHLGKGYLLPVEFFAWWLKHLSARFKLVGQDKKTLTQYHLCLGKMGAIQPIKLRGRAFYFFGLQYFDTRIGVGYVKIPRKKRCRAR